MSFFPYQTAIWLGVSAYHAGCLARQWITGSVSPVYVSAEFIGGAFISRGLWITTEYVAHRYLLHGPLYQIYHKKHHDSPIDNTHMFITPLISIPASLAYYHCSLILIGNYTTTILWVFMPLHYLAFECIHWITHQPIQDKNSFVYAVKQYHKTHHVNPDLHYGISSPSADFLFNTLEYSHSSVYQL